MRFLFSIIRFFLLVLTVLVRRGSSVWVADRRLYLDKDGNAVEADNPERATLLVAEGGSLPLDRAKELGLVEDDEADTDEADTTKPNTQRKAKSAPPDNKAKNAPDENKAADVNAVTSNETHE